MGLSFAGRVVERQSAGGLRLMPKFQGCYAGTAYFRGEHLQNLERQARVGLHQGVEIVVREKAELGAVAGDGSQSIGRIADQAGESEQRAGAYLYG